MNGCTAERLHDSELAEATGGHEFDYPQRVIKKVYDSRGRYCGRYVDGILYYWPCKKCGRPTHLGSGFHQCDKCDDWFWTVSDTRYYGTEDELKSASDAN